MGIEEPKDPFKGVDWKAIGGELQKDPSAAAKPVIKKRLPKKIRQIPHYYFHPLRSRPSVIALNGACITGGIGADMLLEIWINKRVERHRNLFFLNATQREEGSRKRKMRTEASYGSLTSRVWTAL
ncbi:uncharacterized protein LOC8264775 [Ricinus communis]|uniref:Uncharacterized protein n=1 Tax=Ricinus communis TaxID=3988 RepID=B9SGB8_RICCO|nr:uncharacterized protein LOC8264775 [Ricinus communis]EEF37364.1 conserved hypothetical protein [Ricinus communis]|eukprot:XP_015578360.1 uncharacterized protein LOC8264775 [Ricinus communis]